MTDNKLRIVFMGTPDFAVATLQKLVESHQNVVGVVTVADKPAGRGQKLQESPVKKYAVQHNIPVFQPDKLKSPEFIDSLSKLNADLFIVVAFRMLPEIVWSMPRFGTFNLHASLLPQYRGAAPINWAIINGEKETGVTTFFINKEIDTGAVIFQEKINIDSNDTAGKLHDKLMILGANLVLKTVLSIHDNNYNIVNQTDITNDKINLKPAPKIFKENCEIDWKKPGIEVYNFIRGLSPYPGAWTTIKNNNSGKSFQLKIFETEILDTEILDNEIFDNYGKIISDNKTYLKVSVKDSIINIFTLQLEGKKIMQTDELLRGFSVSDYILI